MALKIGDNFNYQGKKPNFSRDTFNTLDEMKSYPETSIDEGHISLCLANGKRYKFSASNSIDSTTGKWRLIVDTALNESSENPVQNKVILQKFREEETTVATTLSLFNNTLNTKIDTLNTNLSTKITALERTTTSLGESIENLGDTKAEKEEVEEAQKVLTAAITELKEALDDINIAVATAINEVRDVMVTGDVDINGHSLADGDLVLTKDDIGLDRVDNTSDVEKPVSTAQNEALSRKVDKREGYSLVLNTEIEHLTNLPTNDELGASFSALNNHVISTENPHSVTKEQVGLGNVDNTADTDKDVNSAVHDGDGQEITSTYIANVSYDGAQTTLIHGDGSESYVEMPVATQEAHGLMSNADKVIVDSIEGLQKIVAASLSELKEDTDAKEVAMATAVTDILTRIDEVFTKLNKVADFVNYVEPVPEQEQSVPENTNSTTNEGE